MSRKHGYGSNFFDDDIHESARDMRLLKWSAIVLMAVTWVLIMTKCNFPIMDYITDDDIVQPEPQPVTGGCDPCGTLLTDFRQYISAPVYYDVPPDTILLWNSNAQGAPPISADLLWPQGYAIYWSGHYATVIAYDLQTDPYANRRIFTRDSFGVKHALVFSDRSAKLWQSADAAGWLKFAQEHPRPKRITIYDTPQLDSIQTDMVIEAFLEVGTDTCHAAGTLIDIRGKAVAQCRKDQLQNVGWEIWE